MKIRDHYEVRFRDCGPAITDEDLDHCQSTLGLRFPTAYRNLLRLHNGGRPNPSSFLPNHVEFLAIEVLFSISPDTPDRDIRSECLRLRAVYHLSNGFVPIAKTTNEVYLLCSCLPEDRGALYFWPELGDGFRLRDPDYDTVFRIYFPVDQLLLKLGPSRNREDMAALFFRLCWAATNSQTGVRTAQQLVAAGYDINFVLPGFVHPVFCAILGDAFGVAEQLVLLGTRCDHVDKEGTSVIDRLTQWLEWWTDLLAEHNKGAAIYEMASRKIKAIEGALSVYLAK